MNLLNPYVRCLLVLWPLVVTIWASFYRRKQNGLNPWTGGPISWPKAFWLSYTIQTWFFLPLLYLTHKNLNPFLTWIIIFHLLSWWSRGLLELVMIYKWFNWSPKYGISHDLFHIGSCLILIGVHWLQFSQLSYGSFDWIVALYVFVLLVTTSAEISFAFLFLQMRSIQEARDNIYFASDDPKWIFINRYTAVIVTLAFIHLFYQSYYLLRFW